MTSHYCRGIPPDGSGHASQPISGHDMSLDPSAAIIPRSVARAIVIKDEEIFFLAEHDGGVPPGNQDGFGLYYMIAGI